MNSKLWNRVKIGDVAHVTSGYSFKSEEFGDEGIPVIKINNVRDGYVDLSNAQYVDSKYLELEERHHINNGDVLISLTGSHITQPGSVVGRIAKYTYSQVALLNQRAGKITVFQDKCDKGFLFYLLSTDNYRRALALLAHGAASQANISPKGVEQIDILLPPLPTQRRIADILSAYDDLIENNTRRIRILEQMAQAIYQEWFGKVDKESLPKGWNMTTLGEVCNFVMGQSPASEFYNEEGKGLPFHQGVTNFGERFPTDKVFCTLENRIAEKGDILFSVRAPVGRLNISTKKIIIGRGVCAIRSKTGNQAFVFQQLKEQFHEDDMMGGGTIFKSVTKDDVHGIKFLLPPKDIIRKFESVADTISRELEILTVKNANLRQTRDLLLPRLVSGEIEVSSLS